MTNKQKKASFPEVIEKLISIVVGLKRDNLDKGGYYDF